jgi:hypothetical protein
MVASGTSSGSIYRLKVSIKGTKPPIWRRIEVPSDVTLEQLHDVLQTVVGWSDSHLHQFDIGGTLFGLPDPDDADWGRPLRDERRARLSDTVRGRVKKFLYEYDFGDGWEHVIAVEGIHPTEPAIAYPRCIAGRRACPPEDCGGPWGYAELLTAIADPDHPDHRERREWLDDDFDPEAFDMKEVNTLLALVGPEGR